jgi:hypothetical protein
MSTALIIRHQRLSAWTRACRGADLLVSRCRHDASDAGRADHSGGGPLAGVTVLDLGQVVSGNFCGMLLGYFGAHVIKVEPPQKGCVTCWRCQHGGTCCPVLGS